MPRDEGLALLDELEAFATRPERVYAHRWQRGDAVFWDTQMTKKGTSQVSTALLGASHGQYRRRDPCPSHGYLPRTQPAVTVLSLPSE